MPAPATGDVSFWRVSPRARVALSLLLQLVDEGPEPRGPAAGEIDLATLRESDVTNNDLRWLILRGLVEHGGEASRFDATPRSPRSIVGPAFHDAARFRLTYFGVELARQLAESVVKRPGAESESHAPTLRVDRSVTRRPPLHWDRDRGELKFGAVVVRRFTRAAKDQEAILAAFEESAWSESIENPLAAGDDRCDVRRLQQSIEGLNQRQSRPLVRFFRDQLGERVCWELSDTPSSGR